MLKPAKTDGDTSWFAHDRFGMFIHWGLHALPVGTSGCATRRRFPPKSMTPSMFRTLIRTCTTPSCEPRRRPEPT